MKQLPNWHQADLFSSLPARFTTHLPRVLVLMAMPLFLMLISILSLYAQPTIQWDKTIGGSNGDNLRSLQQTLDGGYILGGESDSEISGDKTEASKGGVDYWVVKLHANGSIAWNKTIGGSDWDYIYPVRQTSDGGYILGGWSRSGIGGDKTEASRGDYDYWVVKLDAAGNKVWDKTFGGSAGEFLYQLQQTSDGGYILGGWSASGISGDKTQASKGGGDYWVLKLDAAGNKIWDKSYGGTGADGLYWLQQTSDGGYILGGNSTSGISGDKTEASRGNYDYWIVKIDAAGIKQWDKTFGSSGFDGLFSVQQTIDGGYIVNGGSGSGISGDKTEASKGDQDFWLVKLDGTGNKQWDKTIGGNGYEDFTSLQQISDGTYIVGGQSRSGISGDRTEPSKGGNDYWLVKLDAAGNKVWDKAIGGDSDEFFYSLRQTADKGYILGGSSHTGINGDKTEENKGGSDFWVVKLAPFQENPQVKSFALINADNEQPVQLIHEGEVLNLATLPSRNLNIRIDVIPAAVGSVSYALTGPISRIKWDNTAPYSLFGDAAGNYNKWVAGPGSYTLTATPYAGIDKQGTAGTPRTIHFTIIDQVAPDQYTLTVPAPVHGTVSKSPDQASYASGSTVQLTASPAPGFVFSGWTGDAGGTTNPLSVTMNSNKTIGASFTSVSGEGQLVTGFTLINANNETVIQALTDGQVLNLAALPSRNLNIRIDTNPAVVGSVGYALTGTVRRIKWDNTAPYALFGDDAGNYNKWITPVGSYTLTATPYSGADKTGTAGTPLTIHFTVIDQPGAAARQAQPHRPEVSRPLTLYPNPTADGRLQVQLSSQLQGRIRYSLLSSAGTRLAAGTLQLDTPTGLLEFDFSRQLQAAGLYYLRLEGDNGQQVFKILRR